MTDDAALQTRLRASTRFTTLVHVGSCTSTQDLALEEPGSVCVWADEQTAGRGRRGRVWDGARDRDAEFTLRVEGVALPRPEFVAPALPAAVLVALESSCGERLTIKWPNDLLFHGRKLCGLLIDAHCGRASIWLLGIGVNVNRTHFPDELQEVATSLGSITGRLLDRAEIVLRIAASVDRALDDLVAGELDSLARTFRSRIGLLGSPAIVRPIGEPARTGVLTALDLESLALDGGTPIPLARVDALGPA